MTASLNEPFQTLVLDIGNVLLPFDFHRMARRASEVLRVPQEALRAALDGLVRPFETGRIGEAEFFRQIAMRLGSCEPADLIPLWCDIFEVNEPMAAFLRETRASGRPVYLLSNTNETHARFFEERYPFILETDGRVYSHEFGAMKPDPAIFQAAIGRFGIDPAKALYVDDLEPNVEAARAAGFRAWHYSAARHEEFLEAHRPS